MCEVRSDTIYAHDIRCVQYTNKGIGNDNVNKIATARTTECIAS